MLARKIPNIPMIDPTGPGTMGIHSSLCMSSRKSPGQISSVAAAASGPKRISLIRNLLVGPGQEAKAKAAQNLLATGTNSLLFPRVNSPPRTSQENIPAEFVWRRINLRSGYQVRCTLRRPTRKMQREKEAATQQGELHSEKDLASS